MRHNRDIFSIFFNMQVRCVFSIESPHRGDSNEYTQHTIFNIHTKITLNYIKSAAMGLCSRSPKNQFETAVVNESSVFEPLEFYCNVELKDARCMSFVSILVYTFRQFSANSLASISMMTVG